jgi:hypothetical protein
MSIFVVACLSLAIAAADALVAQLNDTDFQSTLPLTVQQIYRARALSMIVMLWAPIAICAVAGLFVDRALPVPVLALVDFASVITLLIVGFQSASIWDFTIPQLVIRTSFLVLTAGAGLLFMRSIGPGDWASWEDGPVWALLPVICWLCIVGIFLRTWHVAPASFQSAPLHAAVIAVRARPAGAARTRANRLLPVWLAVWLSIFRGGALWAFYCFAATAFTGSMEVSLIIATGLWPSIRPRVRWLFALPVPRGIFLPAIMLGHFLGLAGGYLVSVHRSSYPNTIERGIGVRASQEPFGWSHAANNWGCKMPNVLPAQEFWLPVGTRKVPLITAPWGETFQPSGHRRFGFDVYNPYAVGCGNSERFFDWQFSRATLAVYGISIPRVKSPGESSVDSVVVVTGVRTQVVTVALIALYLLMGMLATLTGDWFRFRQLPQWVRATLMAFGGAAGFGCLIWAITDRLDPVQWLSWSLPASLSGAIAVAMLVLAALYWCTYRLFRQAEFVDKPGTLAV